MGHSGIAWISDIIARVTIHYHHFAHLSILLLFFFLNPLDKGEVNIQMSCVLRLGISQTFRYISLAIGLIWMTHQLMCKAQARLAFLSPPLLLSCCCCFCLFFFKSQIHSTFLLSKVSDTNRPVLRSKEHLLSSQHHSFQVLAVPRQ